MRVVSIIIGGVVLALSYAVFLIPHNIVPGGVSGIAMILHILWKTPVGIVVILLNIPLFLIAIRVLGLAFGVRSVMVIIGSNLLIDFLTYSLHLTTPTSNPILATLYGGVMLGVGLGLVFRGGANTGGTDIVGQILNRYTNLSVGIGILIVDFVVITLAGITLGSIERALFGYIALFISTRVIDLVLEGMDYARAAFVVTDNPDPLVDAIYDRLRRGVTILDGYSPYTKEKRPVIMCVITRRETEELKSLAKKTDKNAFVILTDVFEVLGKGFRSRV